MRKNKNEASNAPHLLDLKKQGNTKLWGRADECLEVAIDNIAGEYCLGTFPVALLGVVLPVELGVCVPDTCSDIDLNQIIQLLKIVQDGLKKDMLQLQCHIDKDGTQHLQAKV